MNAHVGWLLDVNVVFEMMRPHPEPRVASFLDEIADQGIGLASITVLMRFPLEFCIGIQGSVNSERPQRSI